MSESEHLRKGMAELEKILNELKIVPAEILGRVKTKESAEEKLQKTSKEIMPNKVDFSDTIGMRVIFQTDKELNIVYTKLMKEKNILFVKDYVNSPRKDGAILNSDPNDIYQSYHIFTDSLNGVPTEIQLRTVAMEINRLQLAKKYGEGYWKTDTFRKNKYQLGDVR